MRGTRKHLVASFLDTRFDGLVCMEGGNTCTLVELITPSVAPHTVLVPSQLGCTLATLVCALGRTCARLPNTGDGPKQLVVRGFIACNARPVTTQLLCPPTKDVGANLDLSGKSPTRHARSKRLPWGRTSRRVSATADCTCTQTKDIRCFSLTVPKTRQSQGQSIDGATRKERLPFVPHDLPTGPL